MVTPVLEAESTSAEPAGPVSVPAPVVLSPEGQPSTGEDTQSSADGPLIPCPPSSGRLSLWREHDGCGDRHGPSWLCRREIPQLAIGSSSHSDLLINRNTIRNRRPATGRTTSFRQWRLQRRRCWYRIGAAAVALLTACVGPGSHISHPH